MRSPYWQKTSASGIYAGYQKPFDHTLCLPFAGLLLLSPKQDSGYGRFC
ncbi:MAG: hypothetical protein HC816_22730 [Leptolyngbyaceae cyanobacterium RM1_1_2]|nr:hypothetical protein [Leptolyngbyaceae cyanobacterium RM1_1_2]